MSLYEAIKGRPSNVTQTIKHRFFHLDGVLCVVQQILPALQLVKLHVQSYTHKLTLRNAVRFNRKPQRSSVAKV